MKNKKVVLIISTSVLAFFCLGYLRDFVFVNINDALYYISHNNFPAQHSIDKRLEFLLGLSYKELYYAKWMLTILFSVIYFFISYFILLFLFPQQKNSAPVIFVYLFLITVSCIITLIGILLNDNTWTYKISRFLMGIAQSPIPVMILLFAMNLLQTQKQQHE